MYFVQRVVDIIVACIELLIFARVVLEFLAANPNSEFVGWLYNLTAQLIAPFAGTFPVISIGSGSTIELSAIFAMVIYAIIGWILNYVLSFVARVAL